MNLNWRQSNSHEICPTGGRNVDEQVDGVVWIQGYGTEGRAAMTSENVTVLFTDMVDSTALAWARR